MSNPYRYLTVLTVTFLLLASCAGADSSPEPAAAEGPAGEPAAAAATAEVLETMDSGGYTYVRLETADGEIWAAGPVTPVAVGDAIVLGNGQVMTDFHSPSLDRTFPSILFLSSLSGPGEGGMDAAARAHEAAGVIGAMAGRTAPTVEAGSVPRAEGGYTVAELYGRKDALAGKDVAVAGRVVKYNAGIMGKNWLHIQDGSGEAGSNDLTVTTAAAAAVGDLVLVRGKVTLNKDFGAGYSYDLIIEDADVTVQE